jgi:hyperosmotically inducible periplasmic protein
MKPHLTLLAPAIIVASLWQPLRAEDHPVSTPLEGDQTRRVNPDRPSVLSTLAKSSDIIGLEVRNYQDEKLGKVQDLIIDVGASRIVGLVVSTGGVLGVGADEAPVPLASFHYDASRKLLQLNSTQDALKAAPRLEVTAWDEFKQPAVVGEIYRYYKVTPYHNDSIGRHYSTDRDFNTGNRASDASANRGSDELTPIDQGNNEKDLEMTAQIRKDVMANSELTYGAKNVKIITVNGRVTLRGSVPTEAERDLIVKLAKSAAEPDKVDDQIQVQGAKTKER